MWDIPVCMNSTYPNNSIAAMLGMKNFTTGNQWAKFWYVYRRHLVGTNILDLHTSLFVSWTMDARRKVKKVISKTKDKAPFQDDVNISRARPQCARERRRGSVLAALRHIGAPAVPRCIATNNIWKHSDFFCFLANWYSQQNHQK